MAMHHIRLKTNDRQGRQGRPAEEAELFQIPVPVTVRFRSVEIALIVNKIESDAFMLIFKNPYIAALSQIVHIEVIHIFHTVTPLLLDTQVLGDYNPYIKKLFVKALRQRANYICQSSCLDKRHCF